jgi:hypothetical protein
MLHCPKDKVVNKEYNVSKTFPLDQTLPSSFNFLIDLFRTLTLKILTSKTKLPRAEMIGVYQFCGSYYAL